MTGTGAEHDEATAPTPPVPGRDGSDSIAGAERDVEQEVGVGPHPEPWPADDRYDPELLAAGDRRNVIDRYRYWTVEAIRADLDGRRHPFHVVIENWQHDLNIGTVVRTANAFLAAEVHIVGKRRWNRRGAMVTDRYQHVRHHPDPDVLLAWATDADVPLIGIDNLPGSVPLSASPLPERCALVFGQEGPGLSERMRPVLSECRSIPQFGSTRSINAGVAAGIAMHAWITTHVAGGA
ncbi:MAG: RNA methyltransferase [Actinomycetota bacterium]